MNPPAERILHVDLDAFYAGVEVLKDPSLAGVPVIVGGTGNRGVVASASYEARAFGVRSAMPVVRARRLCPDAVILPSDFDAYRAHSNRFREVLLGFTPSVEPLSLDEAFLDVSGATRLFGPPEAIARAIRAEVAREVGVTCSVGVAPTKFVAKLASDERKPDGMYVVRAGSVRAYLDPLPAGRLWGVGEKTLERLGRIGVRTIGDIAATPHTILERLLGQAQATHLTELSHGRDDRKVVPYEAPKSVSHEETFERDLDAEPDILREVLHLAGRVGHRLRVDGFRARTVTLKVRLTTFQTLTRSRTMSDPTDVAADLYHVAADLYRSLPGRQRRVRLLGVAATGLEPAGAQQLALVHEGRWGDVERALDRIESRFGSGRAMPATLLERGSGRRPPSGGGPG